MRILIIEDEARIARYVARLVRETLGFKLTTLHVCKTLEAGKDYLERHKIDLLLLDLNLHGEDGFEVLKKLVAQRFHTIVVSAYGDRAIEAFEYGVLDFVAKPFGKARIAKALHRYLDVSSRSEHPARYLAIRSGKRIRLFPLDDVIYCKGARSYSEVHFRDGTTELHDKPLVQLCKILPLVFERIHKSYVVNMTEVSEVLVSSGTKYELVLKNGEKLPVGRTRYGKVREKWFG